MAQPIQGRPGSGESARGYPRTMTRMLVAASWLHDEAEREVWLKVGPALVHRAELRAGVAESRSFF